ncbi:MULTISPECIES: MFS transporter [Paenibacillus]|uniref:MFS transporter n=1 Tax=Paenibacillus TaxID=44249 RepID=UPI0022B8A754|nr:MFS transporter [Paenibacillus caseinilyticus]MCZ8523957.1 MFS transporter [Paenibacillus caseinilyticus]
MNSAPSASLRESLVIPLWSLTVLLVVMNTTMFNVALPTVASDLGLSPTNASWIVTGYSILFAIASITYSRLSDFIAIRTLLAIGLFLLGAGSVIGLFSHHFYGVLIARLLQAAGAAAAPGLGVVLVTKYIPVERRGKSMSTIISAASFGFGLGPIVGGTLSQYFGWNMLFIVTAMVLLLLPVFYRSLPVQPPAPVRFDGIGALLIGLGVTGLLLFLTSRQWLTLAVGAVSLAGFWWRIHRTPDPFVQPALLRNRSYTSLLFMGFIAYVLNFSSLFLMPMMLSRLFGTGSTVTGFLIFPGAILTALLSPRIGRWIDRAGNTPVIAAGHAGLILAAAGFALFSAQSVYAIAGAYMVLSVSVSAIGSSVSNEMSRILAPSEVGSGMGLSQLTQFFGGALGVALTSTVLAWQAGKPASGVYAGLYWVMAAAAVVSAVLCFRYVKRRRTSGTVSVDAVEPARG